MVVWRVTVLSSRRDLEEDLVIAGEAGEHRRLQAEAFGIVGDEVGGLRAVGGDGRRLGGEMPGDVQAGAPGAAPTSLSGGSVQPQTG